MSERNTEVRKICKYGESCYQTNPEHLRKYKHPKRKSDESLNEVPSKRKMNGEKSNKVQTNLCMYTLVEDNIKDQIEALFLVKMPDDFFSFYSFCKSLSPNSPCQALKEVGLQLVGPFDLFDKTNLKTFTQQEALRHFRYYYDPPEFQTVLKGDDKTQLHYGYFRDEPKEVPNFVARNLAASGCTIDFIDDNLFSAVNGHLVVTSTTVDPFKRVKIEKIRKALIVWCKKENISMVSTNLRKRKKNIIAKTFHSLGIIVPYNKETQVGYRELTEDYETLKKIFKDITEAKTDSERSVYWTRLQPVITYASIANDEFDFGTGLELGLNMFCFGEEVFHKTILRILSTSYELLGRGEFAQILAAHLENRTKGTQLNTITVQ